MEQRTYKIKGMDCAEEVEALRGTVGKLPGVSDLDFNILDGTMNLQFEAGAVNEGAIRQAIRRAGMEAQILDPACPRGVCAVEENWWQKRGRMVLCWSSGLLVLAGFLTHVVLHGDLIHAAVGAEDVTNHDFPPLVVLFYALAVVTGGWFIAPKAWLALRRFRADMNLLMTIAVIGAMVIGQWFEAGTVTFLFAFSLLLESWSVGRARRAIRGLVDMTPPTARFIAPSGDIQEKPVGEIPLGAAVLVRPGEKIPLDGIVTQGRTSVNQAPITGESMPVAKEEGAEVFAGTINGDGAIEFKATRVAADTTLARIIHMVESAQSRKAPVEQWVEKFARYYTPSVIAVAIFVAVVPPLFGGPWGKWFYEALVMLVIACPCALVISTPVSIVAALTAAAKVGVLIKGGAFLEAVGRVKAFALDKTGTLTTGHPEVREIVPLNGHTAHEILAYASALEAHSEDPLAAAVLQKAKLEKVQPRIAHDFRALKGRGAE